MQKKVLIHGPVLTRTGYGEMARFALKSFLKYPERFDVYLNNITWGAHPSWVIDIEMRDIIDSLLEKTAMYVRNEGRFDISIQCTIPPEFKKYADVNIGYTAGIETTKAHPSWILSCNQMDKIITISSFSKKILEDTIVNVVDPSGNKFEMKLNKPIDYIGFPVKTLDKKEIENLELESNINFLAIGQDGPRKNLDNVIAWFIDNFKDNSNVGLILKMSYLNCSTLDEHHMRRKIGSLCAHFPNKKCKIYYVSGNLSDEEMNYLYQHEKVVGLISLSHGEGYGLPMFEAAYNALPVITCGWSGHMDFLNYVKEKTITKENGKKKKTHISKTCYVPVEFTIADIPDNAVSENITVKDSKWCYPDRNSFYQTINKFLNKIPSYKSMAEDLQKHLLSEYEENKMYEKFVELVSPKSSYDIDAWLESMNVEDV